MATSQVALYGAVFKQLRQYIGRTQSEVAYEAGIDDSYVHRIEAGKSNNPTINCVTKLTNSLPLPETVKRFLPFICLEGSSNTDLGIEGDRYLTKLVILGIAYSAGDCADKEAIEKYLPVLCHLKESPDLDVKLREQRFCVALIMMTIAYSKGNAMEKEDLLAGVDKAVVNSKMVKLVIREFEEVSEFIYQRLSPADCNKNNKLRVR